MSFQNLDQWVAAHDDLLTYFREYDGADKRTDYQRPPEQTNWLDEKRAQVETCALGDLSHHMTAVRIEGPEVLSFLRTICVNGFDAFDVGHAKQIVMCSPHGYLIGDGPLLRLDDRTFYGPGIHGTKWLKYQLEIGEFDVTADIEPPTDLLPDNTPDRFVYQLQGPRSYAVLDQLTDADFRAIGFFDFEEIPLAGRDVIAFSHGMSPEAGFEFIGPFEYADEIKAAILSVGEEHGIRELGKKSYYSQGAKVGWLAPWPKPVYESEAMKGYRQWVDVSKEREYGKAYWADGDLLETAFSIEGSFDADDIREYYLDPVELGYGRLIDFDHEFIGKDALEDAVENQERKRVSLVWDAEDVKRINNSIFGAGETYKIMDDLPTVSWAQMAYDEVVIDGEQVGLSHTRGYQWDLRGILSLACIDIEHSDPGTEATLVWGEPVGMAENDTIPEHVQTDIQVTVQPSPFVEKQK